MSAEKVTCTICGGNGDMCPHCDGYGQCTSRCCGPRIRPAGPEGDTDD
jgi:hypothetical protein